MQKMSQWLKQVAQADWSNNALFAGLLVTITGIFLTYILGIFDPAPETPGSADRRRADAEQLVTDISDVGRHIGVLYNIISSGRGPRGASAEEAYQDYLDLRASQSRVAVKQRLTDLDSSVQGFLDAYASALTAADKVFDCAHNLMGVRRNQSSSRNLDIPIAPHPLTAVCPEQIDLSKGNPRYPSSTQVADALALCEAELASAAERIADGDFRVNEFSSCQNTPDAPALEYHRSLD